MVFYHSSSKLSHKPAASHIHFGDFPLAHLPLLWMEYHPTIVTSHVICLASAYLDIPCERKFWKMMEQRRADAGHLFHECMAKKAIPYSIYTLPFCLLKCSQSYVCFWNITPSAPTHPVLPHHNHPFPDVITSNIILRRRYVWWQLSFDRNTSHGIFMPMQQYIRLSSSVFCGVCLLGAVFLNLANAATF